MRVLRKLTVGFWRTATTRRREQIKLYKGSAFTSHHVAQRAHIHRPINVSLLVEQWNDLLIARAPAECARCSTRDTAASAAASGPIAGLVSAASVVLSGKRVPAKERRTVMSSGIQLSNNSKQGAPNWPYQPLPLCCVARGSSTRKRSRGGALGRHLQPALVLVHPHAFRFLE